MADLFQTSQTLTPSAMNTNIAQGQWNAAKSIYQNPYQAYTGQGIAGLTPAQQQAYAMITGGGLNNVGQPALNQALQAAQGAAGYTPNLGLASQGTAAQIGKQAPVSVTGYGGATLDPAVQAQIERLGQANMAQSAAVDRAGIRDLVAGQGSQYMNQYLNPYENQVVNATLSDLDRARQMAIVMGEDNAIRAGGYGGSRHGVADSLTNEAALRQSALTAAQLRQAGFNTAANLGMSDADRAMQAGAANQGVDLSTMTSNAGFQQATNLANTAAQNQYGLANAQFGNAANLANAGWANDRNLAQGQMTQQAGIASMQAANAANQMNAQMELQRALANAQSKNQFGLANMDAKNNFALANANLGLQGAQLGLGAANTLGNLSNQQRTNYMQNASALETVGASQQAQKQREADWAYQQYLRQQQDPYLKFGVLNAVNGPGGGTSTYSPSNLSKTGDLIGIGGSLLGLLGG